MNHSIYFDVGNSLKSSLRGIVVGLSTLFAFVQYHNNMQTYPEYTYFRAVFATLVFVAATQMILAIFTPLEWNKIFDRHIKWMIELFLDFFCLAIALLTSQLCLQNCPLSTPVQQCFYPIMRVPIYATSTIGSLCFVLFFLTLLKK